MCQKTRRPRRSPGWRHCKGRSKSKCIHLFLHILTMTRRGMESNKGSQRSTVAYCRVWPPAETTHPVAQDGMGMFEHPDLEKPKTEHRCWPGFTCRVHLQMQTSSFLNPSLSMFSRTMMTTTFHVAELQDCSFFQLFLSAVLDVSYILLFMKPLSSIFFSLFA